MEEGMLYKPASMPDDPPFPYSAAVSPEHHHIWTTTSKKEPFKFLSAEQSTHIPLNVTLHRLKGKHCPMLMQVQAFKNNNNSRLIFC
jgi:hypothetical protein